MQSNSAVYSTVNWRVNGIMAQTPPDVMTMAQHFLLSRQAKTLSLAQVFRMSDAEAETMFRSVRWAETDGAACCPHCGALGRLRLPPAERRAALPLPRAAARISRITAGTLFASHKLPLRTYLAAIAIFCNEVKGKSMLAMSPRSGRVLQGRLRAGHKLREAMAEEMKGRQIGDDRPEAEVDGAYFGGYVKPANCAEDRVDRRLREPDRQAQGRGRDPRARRRDAAGRVPVRKQAASWIKRRVAKGTVAARRRSPSWNDLHAGSR